MGVRNNSHITSLGRRTPSQPPTSRTDGELLTLEQAAAYLGYTVSGLRKLKDKRQIKYMQNGQGPIRFAQEWLDEFVESLSVNGPDNEPARVYDTGGFGFN